MIPYALTIFTGAFLLFQVQPLIGKYILPWFGGSPGVWTTCLLFFQVLLLAGYAYAHLSSTRLRPQRQMLLHLVLLAAALACLPITPSERWKPQPGDNPTLAILGLLTVSIGLPYFVLSASGPLLQSWFSRAQPGRSPYRLYSLSNVGSLLALLSYPFFFEPRFSRRTQALLWSAGLLLYAACCAYCAIRARRASVVQDEGSKNGDEKTEPPGQVGAGRKSLWIAFPAVASMLLLATTNKLCQDVAVVPFLWILPLALYLLSFILCFDHPRWYVRELFSALLVVAVSVVCALLFNGNSVPLAWQVTGYASALFVACMVCHGELFQLKPPPAYLTGYYLYIATGGALGGVLVAVVAPAVFNRFVELEIAYWLLLYLVAVVCLSDRSRVVALGTAIGSLAAGLIVPVINAARSARAQGWGVAVRAEFGTFYHAYGVYVALLLAVIVGCLLISPAFWRREWRPQFGIPPLVFTTGLGIVLLVELGQNFGQTVEATRNFYGALTVTEHNADDPVMHYFLLTHGSITHGFQLTQAPQSTFPTSYYGNTSGVGLAVRQIPGLGGKRIGVVGLGTGSLAAYGRRGDTFRFYEINPAVEQLARTRFSYLLQSEASVDVVLGDARLSLERQLRTGDLQRFDVLALDAFSSDAIPVHLLTKEAFQLYLQHMAPGGIIAVHTSNRYLNLNPVVFKTAASVGLNAAMINDEPDQKEWWLYRSTWILLSRSADTLMIPEISAASSPDPEIPAGLRIWTDDYASLYPLLR